VRYFKKVNQKILIDQRRKCHPEMPMKAESKALAAMPAAADGGSLQP
jgi:hypothetical protein